MVYMIYNMLENSKNRIGYVLHYLGTITILLDLLMHLDDMPLGLSLQKATPFRYSCYR